MRQFVFLTALVGLLGCQPAEQDAVNHSGLIYCSEGSPATFNPQVDTSGTVVDATSYQIYDRLIDISDDTEQFEPALALSWAISSDSREYTFTLRDGVAFQSTAYFTPTRPFNAEDVVFSFSRIIDSAHPYHAVGKGVYPFFESIHFAQNIAAIEAIDATHVRFTLNQPDSTFLSNLATHFSVILSAEYASQLMAAGTPELIDSQPVGTGPFYFYDYQVDSHIKFKQHPAYWQGASKLKKLIYDITPQGTVRLAKLLTSECDVMSFPHTSDIALIEQNPELAMLSQTGFNVGFMAFNTNTIPLNNPKVREAISLAIDQQTILDAVYYNTAAKANGLLPPSSWAYDKARDFAPHDPVRARQLLAEAGLANGFPLKLWVMPIQRSYNPNAMKMGLLIQESLAAIGIDVELVTHEWHVFRRKLDAGEHEAVLLGWTADNPDPDNFFRPLLSCQGMAAKTNRANWCHAEFDELINQARKTTDMKTRKQLYSQAQQLIFEHKPLIPLAHGLLIQVHRQEVSGLAVQSFGGIDFSNASRE